jgi:hypothetical protein
VKQAKADSSAPAISACIPYSLAGR